MKRSVSTATKRCTRCKTRKPTTQFCRDASRGDGLNCYCRGCAQEKSASWWRQLRQQVIAKLGGACARCGFDDERALQVDHVHGNGRQDRREKRTPKLFYAAVLNDSGGAYQLLCANCNQIKKVELGEHGNRWLSLSQ